MNEASVQEHVISAGQRDLFLTLLAMSAGGMDALGLLGLGNVFTSALSGNTILLGIAMAQGQLGEAILCSVVFLGFIPGAIVGAAYFRRIPKGPKWTKRTTSALAIECAILLAFIISLISIGNAKDTMLLVPLVFLSSLAMGLQYMTMLRLNVSGVTTTFVTSTVVNLACRLAVPEDSIREGESSRWKDKTNRFLALIWSSYFGGAILSAALLIYGERIYSGLFSLILVLIVVMASFAIFYRARANKNIPK